METTVTISIPILFKQHPFGMLLKGRTWELGIGYRYGFNGKEQTDEIDGNGNIYDYGFRIYNSRLGRFLSKDPLTKSFPWFTPYQYASNSPIALIDLDGTEGVVPAPPPADNAITNAGAPDPQPNRMILPNTPHIEYTYREHVQTNIKGEVTRVTWDRITHYYDLPITPYTQTLIDRYEGKVTNISEHVFENGEQWQLIGPFTGTGAAVPPPLPQNVSITGEADADLGTTRNYSMPAAITGVSFNGTFDAMGSATLGYGNQIIVTDGTGTVLFNSGMVTGSVPININVTTPSNSISITIVSGVPAGTATATDVDNFTLTGQVVANPMPAAAGGPVYNSPIPRNANTNEYVNKRPVTKTGS